MLVSKKPERQLDHCILIHPQRCKMVANWSAGKAFKGAYSPLQLLLWPSSSNAPPLKRIVTLITAATGD